MAQKPFPNIPMQDSGNLTASACSTTRISVLLPMPFAGPFDYRAPVDMDLQPGDIVVAPLGKRQETGVVWDATSSLPADLAPPATEKRWMRHACALWSAGLICRLYQQNCASS